MTNQPTWNYRKMSTNIKRAAEVIDCEYGPCNDDINHDGRQAQWSAEALVDQGLLVTDEQARLIRLGEAVERVKCNPPMPTRHRRPSWFDCLDAIYAEAERSDK